MQVNKFVSSSSLPRDLTLTSVSRQILPAEISITCFENQVPSFIEPELVRLYGSLFSSLPFLQVYGDLNEVNTYIARKGNEITSVLLYKQSEGKVQVLNEVINIAEEEIIQFATHLFGNYKSVKHIAFHAVTPHINKLPLPSQRYYYTDNIVLVLPKTEEEYVASLGKSTRKNIKHHLSRSKRSFPSFKHQVYLNEAASEDDIRAIIEYNRLRMADKNKVSSLDDEETERIIKLVKLCGLVSVIKIDGQVRAGAICFQTGDHYSSLVNAHDPQYNDFRLGTLCCYLTILECIKRKGKQFHFLWGRYEYKFALLGVRHDLEQISVYRSYLHLLLDGRSVLIKRFKSLAQKIKFWLIEESRKSNHRGKILAKLLCYMRH